MTWEDEREELDKKLKVDRYKLETQWEEQTELFRTWAKRLTTVSIQVEKKKRELDRLYCLLDTKARRFRNGEKFTEAVIKTDITLNTEYIDAQDALDNLQADMAELKTDVQSILERKSALEHEVKLYGQEYFSKPFASEKDREVYKQDSTKTRIREKINSIPDTSIKRTK